MSTPIRSSVLAGSNDFRVQIYRDSEAERQCAAAQQSESKENFSEIPLTSIKIHSPQSLFVQVAAKPQEPQPPETPLGRLPHSLYLIIAALSKYEGTFNLSLTCRYFWKNLSVERMVEGTAHSPEQAWKNFVMNEYPLDFQHYDQNGLSPGSFQNFYKQRVLFHRNLETPSIATFPKLDLPIKIENNRHLDANCHGIVTLSNLVPSAPEITLWSTRTGAPLASAIIGIDPFQFLTAIRCRGREIVYGNTQGGIGLLSIEDRTSEEGALEEKILVERGGFNINQCVNALALSEEWQAVGTVRGKIIMRQKSSGRTTTLRWHQKSAEYLEFRSIASLEFIGDDCIASASRYSSRIVIWKTTCQEGKVDWAEENRLPPIILNTSSPTHYGPSIRCLHWVSPDRLYSGDQDGTIRVWNPFNETDNETDPFLYGFKVHQKPVSSIQVLQDRIISTGEDGKLVIVNEAGEIIQSSLASTTLAKIVGTNMVTIDLKDNLHISKLNEKSVKASPRFNKKTIAKTLGVVLLVAVIAVTIFFVIQDQDKN